MSLTLLLEPNYLLVEGKRHLQGYAAVGVPQKLQPHISPGDMIQPFQMEWVKHYCRRKRIAIVMEESVTRDWQPSCWVLASLPSL